MNRKVLFSPSLMCMDYLRIGEQIKILDERCDMYHVDIMDGMYVKSFSWSPMMVEAIKPITTKPIDIHPMVMDPEALIPLFAKSGADYISLHCDRIIKNAFQIIDQIKKLGCKVGAIINPSESLGMIEYYIELLDKITVMTVDPGYAGQKFLDCTLKKVEELVKIRDSRKLDYLIEIDGACNKYSFKKIYDAGADVFIIGGSGLFGESQDLVRAWGIMQENFARASMALK